MLDLLCGAGQWAADVEMIFIAYCPIGATVFRVDRLVRVQGYNLPSFSTASVRPHLPGVARVPRVLSPLQ